MKTWLSGDVSKRLALGGDAETAHELEFEIRAVAALRSAHSPESSRSLENVFGARSAEDLDCIWHAGDRIP